MEANGHDHPELFREDKALRGRFAGGHLRLRMRRSDGILFPMAPRDYSFVTRWRMPASPREVDLVLSDTAQVARWWPELYAKAEVLESGDITGLGKEVRVETKGFLPYVLKWSYIVTEAKPAEGFSIAATGDIEGDGRWLFEPDGPSTNVIYHWNVRAEKPLLRYFSFLLRPLFAANHNYVMKKGEEGLKKELMRRRMTK
jgi:hypothetical protein